MIKLFMSMFSSGSGIHTIKFFGQVMTIGAAILTGFLHCQVDVFGKFQNRLQCTQVLIVLYINSENINNIIAQTSISYVIVRYT